MLKQMEHFQLIRRQALVELEEEGRRADVDAEKAKILALRNQSTWARLLALLPFTFTWKTK